VYAISFTMAFPQSIKVISSFAETTMASNIHL
jgi:hypothetical protein